MINEKLRSKILDGALQDYKRHLAGYYKGFYITVDFVSPQYVIRINASSPNDAGNISLKTLVEQQKAGNKHLNKVDVYSHTIVLSVKTPNLAKNLPNVINDTVEPIINMINGAYSSGCENCGDTLEQIECYEINGQHHFICENCVSEIQGALQNQQDITKSQKSNLVAGLVGAFLGALIGCALWILIYKLGYIVGLAGAVTSICALKGYEMFGKHLDKKGVICSILIIVIMIFFANKFAWAWEAYDALSEYGYRFSDCFRGLSEILKASELTGSYYADLGIGYLLTLLASYKNIINAFKASTGNYTIKKATK